MTQEELTMLREHMIETLKERITPSPPSEEGGEEEPSGDLTDLFQSLWDMADEDAESIGLHITRPPTTEEKLEQELNRVTHLVDSLTDRLDELEEENLALAHSKRRSQKGTARGMVVGMGLMMMGIPLVFGGLFVGWKLLELLSGLLSVSPMVLSSAMVDVALGALLLSRCDKLGDRLARWASEGFDDGEDDEF